MATADKKDEDAEVKEAKAQARRGEPRSEAPVEDKEPAEAKKERAEQVEESKFEAGRLIADHPQFDVPPYVVAGALALRPNQKNFTVAEVRALITERDSTEVK